MTKSQRRWIVVGALMLLLMFVGGVGVAVHFKMTQYSTATVASFAAGNPCFATYATVEAPKRTRATAFSECTLQLDDFRRGGGVATRQQVFGLIGTPDLEFQYNNGQVDYLYWFLNGTVRMYCMITFTANNDNAQLTQVGYNTEGTNDLSTWSPYIPPPPPPSPASPSPGP